MHISSVLYLSVAGLAVSAPTSPLSSSGIPSLQDAAHLEVKVLPFDKPAQALSARASESIESPSAISSLFSAIFSAQNHKSVSARSLGSIWNSLESDAESLVKPIEAPGNKDTKRGLESVWDSLKSDAESLVKPIDAPGNKDTKRDLDTRDESAISSLFRAMGSLVKPIDAPGNKDIKRDLNARGESSLSSIFRAMGSLVKPVEVPGNKDIKRDTSASDFVSITLNEHNTHRAKHSVSALTYDNTLGNYAATVASTCKFEHDQSEGGGGYGQNIAASTGFDNTADALKDAISTLWYDGEEPKFSSLYGQQDPDMTNFDSWGHFTQMVWSDSTSVGCSVQYCQTGTIYSSMPAWFTVCNYGHEGNIDGEYATNVKRPSS